MDGLYGVSSVEPTVSLKTEYELQMADGGRVFMTDGPDLGRWLSFDDPDPAYRVVGLAVAFGPSISFRPVPGRV